MDLKFEIGKLNEAIHTYKPAIATDEFENVEEILQSEWHHAVHEQLRTRFEGEEYTIFLKPNMHFFDNAMKLTIDLGVQLRRNTYGEVLYEFEIPCAENLLHSQYAELAGKLSNNLPNNKRSPEERSEAARKAVNARWAKSKKN